MDTLDLKGTRVYMKSGSKLAQLKNILINFLSVEDFIVYGISNCGMENEKISYGIENLGESSGYLTIVIVKEKSCRFNALKQ